MPSTALTYQGPALDPFQGEYRGLVFGEGTDLIIDGQLEGLVSVETRAQDKPIPRSDGAFPAIDYAKAETVTFPLAIVAAPGTTRLADLINDTSRTFRLTRGDTHWFRWHGAYGIRRWRARPARFAVAENPEAARSGIWRARVALALADPRGYSDDFSTRTVHLFTPDAGGAAGWELPATDLPLDITAEQQSRAGGIVTIYNQGTADAWPIIQFQNLDYQEAFKITLRNLDTGEHITIETALAEGQTLVADMDALVRGDQGPHVSIDGATRYGQWTPPRQPFRLAPGQNRLRLDAEGSTIIVAHLIYRDTHI